MARNICPREKDFSQWYLDTIYASELADYSPVRGCMVIRPLGYAIWERIQRILDRKFKETGHVNAYFPLFIPESFLRKEAQHVEGFAPECAVVTHGGGEKLEEVLYVRPTSETIIGAKYAEWVHSWRDLPILINQWANVVRWEKRTRLFLRTSEFLWQEGHTAHETKEEAREETLRILEIYREFAEKYLMIPVLSGEKTESERFAGAEHTYCIEGMMQDGKALQMGTSHDLGQNFSKAFEIRFEGRDQQLHYVWTTSWGVSTRLIGALVMVHGDDEGLVLPSTIAPIQVAFIPIYKNEDEKEKVIKHIKTALKNLCSEEELYESEKRIRADGIQHIFMNEISDQQIVFDRRDLRPAEKHYYWEQRGVPMRIEVGPKDCEGNQVVVKMRIGMDKEVIPVNRLSKEYLQEKFQRFDSFLYERALEFREKHTKYLETYEEVKRFFENERGFVKCFFNPSREVEAKIKEETKATVRLIIREESCETKRCMFTGKPSKTEVIFGQSY